MQMHKLIDSHCHLDLESFDEDRTQVLQRAIDNNISDIVIPGTQKIYWDKIRQLCSTHKQLHACYGLHPYWVNNHSEQDLKQLDTYIEHNRPVAIGECGLDFRPQQADKNMQLNFFENQLRIAENHQLPVVIHAVKATEKVIETIRKFKNLTGMIHSYSGSTEQARQLIDLNFYISASGSVTYDRAKKIKSVMKEIPLTSLLLETDAPDQPDQKNHDKRNEPAYLINTAIFIAELRGDSFENIARQTTMNAQKLFNI
jgi:TatD DNase family protein